MKYKIILVFVAVLLFLAGCLSEKEANLPITQISLEKAFLIANKAINEKTPGYTEEHKLVNKESRLISNFESVGFPEKTYEQVWEIKLLPPKGEPQEGIGQIIYINANSGEILFETGYPSYITGKNTLIQYNKVFSNNWRGYFLDGETTIGLEIIDKQGLQGFFKEFGNGSKISVKSMDINKEIPLMYVDYDVQNVFLNGNNLIIKLKEDKKKVNVISIPYDELHEKVLGTYWISTDGKYQGGTLFDDTIPEWVPDEIRWLKK